MTPRLFAVQEIANKYDMSGVEIEKIINQIQKVDTLENVKLKAVNYGVERIPTTEGLKRNRGKILIIGEKDLSDEIKRIIMNSAQDSFVATIDIAHPVLESIKENTQWMFDSDKLQAAVEKFLWCQDYFIVLAMKKNDPLLAMRLYQINYTLDIPWIHGVMEDPFIFVGPTFIPKSGSCYYCFEKFIKMRFRNERCKKTRIANDFYGGRRKNYPMAMYLFAAHLAMETINYCFSNRYFSKNKVLSIYLPNTEIEFNEIDRFPGCSLCNNAVRENVYSYYA